MRKQRWTTHVLFHKSLLASRRSLLSVDVVSLWDTTEKLIFDLPEENLFTLASGLTMMKSSTSGSFYSHAMGDEARTVWGLVSPSPS